MYWTSHRPASALMHWGAHIERASALIEADLESESPALVAASAFLKSTHLLLAAGSHMLKWLQERCAKFTMYSWVGKLKIDGFTDTEVALTSMDQLVQKLKSRKKVGGRKFGFWVLWLMAFDNCDI